MRTRRASVAEEQSYFDSRLSTVMSLDSKIALRFNLLLLILFLLLSQFSHLIYLIMTIKR